MSATGETTDDLTARAAVVARHLAELHRWTAANNAGQPTAPYLNPAPAAPGDIPGGEPGLLPPLRHDLTQGPPLPGPVQGPPPADPVQGAMRPGPDSAPYRLPKGYEVGAWPPPRRPDARADAFFAAIAETAPAADPAAVPPPEPAAPAVDVDVTMAWRTVPVRAGDPNATQAIGLHRAAEAPTPRQERRRPRGIARVLPWNWGRRGRR